MEHIVATILGSLTLGFMLGYGVAWRNGKAELRAYKEGRLDECQQRAMSGGPCWVKGQLPPGAHE